MTRTGIAIGALQALIVVGVIALALFLSNALRPDETQRRAEGTGAVTVQAVDVVHPAEEAFTPRLNLNGVVETRAQTSVSPQVSGMVIRVSPRFRTGATFKRGDLLFQIDPADFELAVERAAAEIAAARSDLMVLKADAEIAIREWRAQYPDREPTALAAREPQIAAAEARLKSAEAARKTAELALRRTTIRAPFDGRVLSTQLEVGEFVSPQTPVGQIYPIEAVEVAATMSDAQRQQLGAPVGQPVEIRAESMTGPLIGKIVRIDPQLAPRTRLTTIRISMEAGGSLSLGAFVDVFVEGETVENTLAIPATSFADGNTVWVVSGNKLATRTVERIAERGDRVIVPSFDVADGVVVVPPVNARDGLPVSTDSPAEEAGVRNVSLER